MSKRQVLMLLGVWVMIFLYLGFPKDWHKVLLFVTGLVIIWIAYSMRSISKGSSAEDSSKNEPPFVDHHGPNNLNDSANKQSGSPGAAS